MLKKTALTCLVALTLHSPALATKFHLASEKEDAATVGNAAGRVIEGVLLKQDDKTYTIRIVGGEITIAKSSVVKMAEDGLTVAAIEKTEKDRAENVAKSEAQRRDVQAAEASARRDKPRAVAPKSEKSLVIEIDFQGVLPGYKFRTFDPVLGRANIEGLRRVIEDYLRREVEAAAHRK